MRRLLGGMLVFACLLVPAACGGDDGGDEAAATSEQPEAGESGVLAVKGDEYAFVMPDEGKAGVVTFEVSNVGKELHEYALARLDEGKTLADVRAALKRGQDQSPPKWVEDVGGVPLLSPGEELSITRRLEHGTYVFLCFIPSPKGVPHSELGMVKTFTLSGDGGRELPNADATITARGASYDVPALEAGRQTIELKNADTRPREFLIVRFEPGKGVRDVDAWFQGGLKGEPPATFLGAMQTIPPGTSVVLKTELEEGVEYTLVDTSGRRPVLARFTPM